MCFVDQCVKYSHNERTLKINELGMSKPKSKRSFIRPKPSFLFDVPAMDTKSAKQCLHRFRERTSFFCCLHSQPEEVDNVTSLEYLPCNAFRLKSENSVIEEMDEINGNGENADQCTSTL